MGKYQDAVCDSPQNAQFYKLGFRLGYSQGIMFRIKAWNWFPFFTVEQLNCEHYLSFLKVGFTSGLNIIRVQCSNTIVK